MKINNIIGLCFMLVATLSQAKDTLSFTQIMYQEAMPGEEPYGYRLLVNEQYLRFDGGLDTDGFILYDRKNEKVISVNHDDRSLFVIQPKAQKAVKYDNIDVKIHNSELEKSPKIENIKAKMHDIVANEKLCRQVLSFDGLLPDVTKAWAEYETVMQLQNQQTLERTPQDMRTDCFLTNSITHAPLFLDFGLPFSVRSIDGTLRLLQGYSQVEKSKSITSIPEDYQEFSL